MKIYKRLALSPYQDESVQHLSSRTFACLFDAPGVGKTPPTLRAAWDKVQETGYPALIIAPAYLVSNWEAEAARWVPRARVSVVEGGTEDRRAALLADADIILCSYHTLNNKSKKEPVPKFPEIDERDWAVIVFDEAHRLRTRDSIWTKRVFSWRNAKSPHKKTSMWFLTGTPMLRDGGNIWPLLHLYDRRRFRGYWPFVTEYCVTKDTPWAKEIYGIKPEKLDDFHALLGEFSLRRTQKDVQELAHLEEVVYDHLLSTPQSVVRSIKAMKREYVLDHPDLDVKEFFGSAGAVWVRQRTLASDPPTKEKPKLDWLQAFLADESNQKRIVVYTWYKATANTVYDSIRSQRRPATLHTGAQTDRQRETALQTFRETENAVIVATISSLKEGINLTESDTVIFVEHSTLPADNEQCIARLKRRGQENLVQVHNLYAKNTVDTAIQKVVTGRTTSINDAIREWLKNDV